MVRRSSKAIVLLFVTVPLFGQGCGDSRSLPPSPTPGGTLTGLEIQGNTGLTSVGETSQLRVLAQWSDGRSTDVTTEAAWAISGPPEAFGTLGRGVATVSTSGLLRANDLGICIVRASYLLGRSERRVTVTPSGTFAVAGRVRQPGASVLRDVLVTEPVSGRSTRTEDQGAFMLGGLIGTELRLTKDNYEPVVAPVRPFDDLVDVPMQPVYRIVAGGSVTGTIAPNDLSYVVMAGMSCGVCRLVRIQSPASGMVRVTVRWTLAATRITVWAGGQEFQAASGSTELVATFPVSPGETIIYVGAPSAQSHVIYDLTTVFLGS